MTIHSINVHSDSQRSPFGWTRCLWTPVLRIRSLWRRPLETRSRLRRFFNHLRSGGLGGQPFSSWRSSFIWCSLAWFWVLMLSFQVQGRELGPVVRLTTWNLHNLFDEVDDRYNDKVYTPQQVDQKLDRLAEVVAAIDPDILAVQEVENRALLQRLAGRLSGYRHVIVVAGNDKVRGIQVGLLSRQAVTGYRTHRDRILPGNHRFSRDCLEVHIGGTLPQVVLVNHFKSKLQRGQTPSDELRRAQAEGVQQIVGELERWRPDLKIAVVGDLNDSMRAACLKPLAVLFDPFGPLPLEEAFTSVHKQNLIVLDHILLNRNLTHHLVPHSASVYHKKTVEKTSDHYPISVELTP